MKRIAKAKSGAVSALGVDASKAVRAGWILAIRCGSTNIIVAEPLLTDAERAAADREAELRRLYAPDLPACRRVLTVDPEGGIRETMPASDVVDGARSRHRSAIG